MNNIILSSLQKPPRGVKSLSIQLAYCFVVSLITLIVMSSVVNDAYISALKEERSNALLEVSASSAVALSGVPITHGMPQVLPDYPYAEDKYYEMNIYMYSHNSFLRVFSSSEDNQLAINTEELPETLDVDGKEYLAAYQLEKIGLDMRTEDGVVYRVAIAPIVVSSGAVAGVLEVMIPESDYSGTVNGFSLSYIFTLFAISISLTLLYFQSYRLISLAFSRHDKRLPKIIRFGHDGCRSIAFFSSMSCIMIPLVISNYILRSSRFSGQPVLLWLALSSALLLYAIGFFGLHSIRVYIFKRFTSRLSMAVSIIISFVMLFVVALFNHPIALIVFVLPIAFFQGMILYFQREYRVYAGRLGHQDYDNLSLLKSQFSSSLYGAGVGAVIAGVIFERFGLASVLLLSGASLLLVSVLSMVIVQHCPASSENQLHLTSFLYALTNRRSGSFLFSTYVSLGIQFAFLVGFVPVYIKRVGLSLAALSFYYLLYAFFAFVVPRFIKIIFSSSGRGGPNIAIASLTQVVAYFSFALLPTAKTLVPVTILLAISVGLHNFSLHEGYQLLIRRDKRSMSRLIVEKAFYVGILSGIVLFSGVLFFEVNIRMPLLIVSLIVSFALLFHPVVNIIYFPDNKNNKPNQLDPYVELESNHPELTNYSNDSHLDSPVENAHSFFEDGEEVQ
ncbi:MAG TPA: MFS transporter [Clostridiaceae bacterium]|nr:MFS transporter [Clostridiaceae bacterium]